MAADQEGPTMSSLSIIYRLLAGAGLGAFFYLGLWFTVRSLATVRHPVLLTLASFWIRTGVVVAGFLFLMKGSWEYALTCIVGFTMARFSISIPLRVQTARAKCP
jgi:F1F0 ATPase subunit 2